MECEGVLSFFPLLMAIRELSLRIDPGNTYATEIRSLIVQIMNQ